MSQKYEFEKHPIHNNLVKLISLLATVHAEQPEHVEILARATQFISNLKTNIDGLGSRFFSENILNYELTPQIATLTEQCAHLKESLDKKDTDQVAQAINQINDYFDSIQTDYSTSTGQFFLPLVGSDQSINQAANTIIQQSENFVDWANQQKEEIQKDVKKRQEELSSINEESKKIKGEIELQENKLKNLSETWVSNFDTEQKKRKKDFDLWLDSFKEKTENDLEKIHSQASEHEKKIRDLYGLAADESITGGYAKDSEQEKKQANRYRLAAIFSIISAVVIQGGIIFLTWGEVSTIRWNASVPFMPITILFVGLAGYLGGQSKKHRDLSISYKRIHLELQSIDPYLRSLPEEKQQEIKAELVKLFFGQREDSKNSEDSVSILQQILSAIKRKNSQSSS